jgi:hypothetical protein
MNIAWTVEAAEELERLLAYIASESRVAASAVADRVLRAERSIAQFGPTSTTSPLDTTIAAMPTCSSAN